MSSTPVSELQGVSVPEPQVLKDPKKSETRSYTVLRKGVSQSPSSPQTWEFVRNVDASTVEQAVTKTVEVLLAASEDNKVEGTFVAIASRSFKPIPVDVEVTTRIKLG